MTQVIGEEELRKLIRRQLIEACKKGQASAVEQTLEIPGFVDSSGKSGRTGLHYAAREGHVKVKGVFF